MDLQHTYTIKKVLEIVLTLKPQDRKIVLEVLLKSLLNEKEILEKISPFHQRYETTYKTLA